MVGRDSEQGPNALNNLAVPVTSAENTALRERPRKPLIVVGWINSLVHDLKAVGVVSGSQYQVVMGRLDALASGFTAVDRLVFTPFPFPFAQLQAIFVVFYMLLGDLHYAQEYGLWAPIPCMFTALAFFGMNEIGISLQNPFGDDENDIDLNLMTRMLRDDIWFLLDSGWDFQVEAEPVLSRSTDKIRQESGTMRLLE